MRFLFKGILGDAVQLQLQITVYDMLKILYPKHSNSLELWISIITAFSKLPKVMEEVIAIFRFSMHAAAVGAKLAKMAAQCRERPSLAEVARERSGSELRTRDAAGIKDMRRQSAWYLAEFCCFTLVLLFMYGWAFIRLLMSHVCEDSMWNMNIHLSADCVDIRASLQPGSNEF